MSKKQVFVTLIEVAAVITLVFVLGILLPPLLGIRTIEHSQPTVVALSEGRSYPPPVTYVPTAISTEQPYPPPLTVTPMQDNTNTPEQTFTPLYTEGPTNTPIPLSTIANDAEGEILFIDVNDEENTNLNKVDVDKTGKAKNGIVKISTSKLPPNHSTMGGLGNVYPSPDGQKLFIIRQSEGPDFMILDINSGKFDVTFPSYNEFFGWYPDNKHILMRDFRGLWLVKLNGKAEVHLAQTEDVKGRIISAAASPDGRQIIYAYHPTASHGTEIWVVGADGSGAKKLFDNPTILMDFAWSPDSTKIAFWDGGYWVMDADGADFRFLGRMPNRRGLPPLWSPDSQLLLTDTAGSANDKATEFDGGNIFLINVQSGEKRAILPDGSTGQLYPSWSPDGQKIAFISMRGGKPDIWIVNIDGNEPNQITTQGHVLRYLIWRKPKK